MALFAYSIGKLVSGRQLVINVEYNQLDPLLKAAGYPEGDVNCETGFSPFPGNINQVGNSIRVSLHNQNQVPHYCKHTLL